MPPRPVTPPAAEPVDQVDPIDPVTLVPELDELVRARWVSPQPVFVPTEQRLVRYGDEITVTRGQLEHPDQPTIAWADDWQPDPILAAIDAAIDTPEV